MSLTAQTQAKKTLTNAKTTHFTFAAISNMNHNTKPSAILVPNRAIFEASTSSTASASSTVHSSGSFSPVRVLRSSLKLSCKTRGDCKCSDNCLASDCTYNSKQSDISWSHRTCLQL